MKSLWNRISYILAGLLTRRRAWMFTALALTISTIAALVWSRNSFDTEVFNMLPGRFDSVHGLKFFNSEFSQSRQLSFGLIGQENAEDFEDFVAHFDEALQEEPWVRRVLHGSPLDSKETLGDLFALLPPLLLSSESFPERLKALNPDTIRARVKAMRDGLASGSFVSEMEASIEDPLGIVLPTVRPMVQAATALGRDGGTDEGRRFELFLAITRQEDLGAAACIDLMQKVRAFRERVVTSWKGTQVEVVVTGRAAYVAEISKSMERDITLTSTVSLALVGLLFFLGFRRLLPLVGIVTLLSISCLAGLAFGALVYSNLSVIAIGFCSILVGLGDDFSLLLLERYRRAVEQDGEDHFTGVLLAIREAGPGILTVAAITGLSFLSLCFSGSRGFAQLGFMIAAGVVSCAVLMIAFLFLFVRKTRTDAVKSSGRFFHGYIRLVERIPRLQLGVAGAVFAALAFIAFSPLWPLPFDTRARSLEPKNSEAAIALARITEAMKFSVDPVVVMLEGSTLQETHDGWKKLSAHLTQSVAEGRLKSFSDPYPFVFSPREFEANTKLLQTVDLDAARQAFVDALKTEGFNDDAFPNTLGMIDTLKSCAANASKLPEWRPELRDASPIHFMLDRFLAQKPYVAVGFVQPLRPMHSGQEQLAVRNEIEAAGVPVRISGWSFTLMDLVPWAKQELWLFGSLVVALVLLLLGIFYRSIKLWGIHVLSMGLAMIGLVASLKLLGQQINLLNVLAFPLVIAVGVDYGLHVLDVFKHQRNPMNRLDSSLKPIVMSGITTASGFGSLCLALNPALSGLGVICALGIAWNLITVCLFTVPMASLIRRKPDAPAAPVHQPEPETALVG